MSRRRRELKGRKEFKWFADRETGGERLIGGMRAGRGGAFLPPGLDRPDRLLVPGDDASVVAFRDASAGRDVIVEVGPGKGRFANGMAAARPEAVVLAIDTRLGFCLSGLKRAVRAGIRNLWEAWGDARAALPAFVPPGTAAEAYLLFPDPWWKRRHAGRRHGPAMVGALADALRPGGLLVLKSDVPEYLAAIVETVNASERFDPAPLPSDLPLTDREVRIVENRMDVFARAFTRR